MNKLAYKTFLYFLLVTLIVLMSYGVYITHPIKSYQENTLLIWIILSIILVPLSIFSNNLIKEQLELRAIRTKSVSRKNKSRMEILDPGCSGCGPLDVDDIGEIFILLIGIVAALLTGMFFGILLFGVEFLGNRILFVSKDSPKHIWQKYFLHSLVIVYAAYFIALFLNTKIW